MKFLVKSFLIFLVITPMQAKKEKLIDYKNLIEIPKDRYIITHVQDGIVYSIKLLKPTKISGFIFGTHGIWLYNTGAIRGGRTLIRRKQIPGMIIKPLTTLFFYPYGSIQKMKLLENTRVFGILGLKSTEIELFQNGSLKSIVLAKTQKILGNLYDKNLKITFNQNGKVLSALYDKK